MIRNLMRGTALASALALPLFSSAATAQIAVSANDNKIALVDGQNTVPANPPPDTVTVLDIGVSPPKVLGEAAGAEQRGRRAAKRRGLEGRKLRDRDLGHEGRSRGPEEDRA